MMQATILLRLETMTLITNKIYFLSGGKASEEVEVTNINKTDRPNLITGSMILPLSKVEKGPYFCSEVK